LQLEQMTVALEMKTSWHIKGNVRRKSGVLYWKLLNYVFVQVFGPHKQRFLTPCPFKVVPRQNTLT